MENTCPSRPSGPAKAKGTQVWVLDRRGGEARQLTEVKGHLGAYAWSPDGKKLLLTIRADDDDKDAKADKKDDKKEEKPKPIVIDRYHFKQDVQGYLTEHNRNLLYLYDIDTQKLEKLTNDSDHDEGNAVWSPDGTRSPIVSNHDPDWDRTINTDVFVVDATPNSTPKKLTDFQRRRRRPSRLEPRQQVDRLHAGQRSEISWSTTRASWPSCGADGTRSANPHREARPERFHTALLADGKTITVLVRGRPLRISRCGRMSGRIGSTRRLLNEPGVGVRAERRCRTHRRDLDDRLGSRKHLRLRRRQAPQAHRPQ